MGRKKTEGKKYSEKKRVDKIKKEIDRKRKSTKGEKRDEHHHHGIME